MSTRTPLAALAVALTAAIGTAQDPPAQVRTTPGVQPPELGAISWHRNHAAGVDAAKASNRPLLVLFQEVPG